jgi:uncharacterized protein (TIGR03437 family)
MFQPQSPTQAVHRLLLLALLAIALVLPSQSQIFNRNLVQNPGAEDGPAAQNFTDPQVSSIPGWTTTGGFSVAAYGGGDFLNARDYVPVDRGLKFFYGGPGNQRATAVETIDLSGAATDIDAGRVKFYLSGYLGFIGGSYDTIFQINLKAEFQDASGKALLTSTATGPTSADISIAAGLLLRTAQGFLPANVRKAKVTIDLYTGSSGRNGYAADNISLVLTTEPTFGANLLVNGDAETDPRTEEGHPVPGWNADSYLAVWKYGDYKMPTKDDPGPSERGKFFFVCPSNHSQCRAFQSVDFSAASKLMDAGKVTFTLSGWFGGATDYPDYADATVTLNDASNKAIGSAIRIGPVTQQDRSGRRGLWQRSTTATVPAGARSAQIDLFFHKIGPVTDNLDAYADNLVFQLDAIQIAGVTNAASSVSGAVAPGEFVSIYGSSLGPAKYAVAVGSQKGLSGAKVTFNAIEAFLTLASATQINALVPYGVGSKADVVVQYNGMTSDPFPLATTDAAPGIFTQQYGPGQIWAVNNDGSFNSASNPVARGGWVSVWATGQGLVDPPGQDGEAITVPKNVKLPVKVSIGGVDAQVLGAVLIYTGEIQVNVLIPGAAPTGDVPLVLTVGTASSRKDATIAIK